MLSAPTKLYGIDVKLLIKNETHRGKKYSAIYISITILRLTSRLVSLVKSY